MKNHRKVFIGFCGAAFVFTSGMSAVAQKPVRGKPVLEPNLQTTVIIDYARGGKPGPPPKDDPPPEPPPEDETHLDGHFEIFGAWADSTPGDGVVDPALVFKIDLRGFPLGSDLAIEDAFFAWEIESQGVLISGFEYENVFVDFGDGVNTYSMRNLGGGGILAATFITWDDVNDNGAIDPGEPLMEMDVVFNSTVKWGTDFDKPRGKWFDVQNVATHENGHVFGIDHPGNAHEADYAQTMFASAGTKETSKRTLEPDGDIPGIQFLYGGP